jgi:sulfopyruvate decarboxylase alpha subunit
MTAASSSTAADWRDQIFEVFQDHDIRQVFHVPDAGHSRLIEACQRSNSIRTVPLTTEEEGVAMAAGAWLGGQRSVLLMQSSGVGNTINLMGLTKTLRFPFLTLITMRGEPGEFNSWQYPMGQGTPKVLEAMGVLVLSVDKADEVKTAVDHAARSAFNGGQAVAVLLRQKMIGIKDFGKKVAK